MANFLPNSADFSGFKSNWKKDLVAGVTVGIVALPLALAFGITTGTGAASGLITAVIAGFLASLFGGSNYQVSGPTGAMTVVLVPIVNKFGVGILAPVGIVAGILVILFGIFKLGNLIKKVPWPVMEGFTLGIALVISLQQIPGALAVKSVSGHGSIGTAIETLKNAKALGINWRALIIVAITLVLKFGYPAAAKRFGIKVHIPASFVAIIGATLFTHLVQFKLPTVGDLPRNLFTIFNLPNSINWKSLIIPIIEVALLAAIESLLSARVADSMVHHQVGFKAYDPNRELFGQGIASSLSSIFGGLPATGAIARTGVNVRSGARTRAAGIIHALFLLLAVFLINPLIALIPNSALAGILIGTSYRIARPSAIKEALATTKFAASVLLITAAVTLSVDLIWGIAIGITLFVIGDYFIKLAKNKASQ